MALTASQSALSEAASAVDRLVLSAVNAPYKRNISAAVLQRCIARTELDEWAVHVASFFTDLPPDLVFGFASSHGISKSKLAETYRAMKLKTGERNPDLEAKLVALAPAS
jgi:hypothetical protein